MTRPDTSVLAACETVPEPLAGFLPDAVVESPAMTRLREVAADAGKHVTRHAFIKPDEAAVILAEIERLQITCGSTIPRTAR
jgi:hypothetical protein